MYRLFSAIAALVMTAGTVAFGAPAHAAPADTAFSIGIEAR